MRRAHCLSLGLAAVALATGLADMAAAQTAPAPAVPRYLNWAGRPDVAVTPVPAALSARPDAAPRRSNRVIPHGGSDQRLIPAPVVPTDAPRRTLTPANAWLHPAPAAPQPAPAPAPALVSPQPVAAVRAGPDFLPDQGGRGQPVPADVAMTASPPAAEVAGPAVDPMAPRRDAPIFHMQQSAAPQAQVVAPPDSDPQAAAASADAPVPRPVAQSADQGVDRGVRRYSVHRLNGQQPDPLTMPAPTMVDVVAVNLNQTIASQDLAQPAEAPTLIRDAQGRVRAQPAAPEGDYQ